MMQTVSSSGVGITFASDYPNSDSYYRLRSYNGGEFHLNLHPHGSSILTGDISSDYIPSQGVWSEFRINVVDTGSRIEVKARVWTAGDVEPTGWQIDCYDDRADRFTYGKIGSWALGTGFKYWDDLEVR
jgi:hypothetical protein